jgi:hypothetical protein
MAGFDLNSELQLRRQHIDSFTPTTANGLVPIL